MTSKKSLDYMYNIAISNSVDFEKADKVRECYNIIADNLEILEILKNKQVNIHFDLVVKDTYEEYLAGVWGSKKNLILTKEEWNELKEWLDGKD